MAAVIVFGVFIGIILAFIAAPVVIIIDRRKLKEMDDLIREFRSLSLEERDRERDWYKSELVRIKGTIWSGDKQSGMAAQDKLSLV